jgi:benzylsuccinate CoA-transferase BbsF subunit
VQFLAQAILEFTANGRMSTRAGNSDHAVAPHGAYQCKGDDRWCVISVNTAEQWEAFCRALDNPPWTKQPEFSTSTGRKENEEKLNTLVQEWTMKHSAEEIMNLMQKAGVPTAVVENAEDIFKNHQLKHRGGFWMIDNPEIGEFPHLGQSSILSKTPAGPRFPAPAIGEHTAYICTQLLGMTDAEFTELFQAGVLE